MIPAAANSRTPPYTQPINTPPPSILGRVYSAVINFFKTIAAKIFTFFTAASNKLKDCFTAKRITAQPTGAPAQAHSAQQVATSSQAKTIRRVPLTNARQYDMEERPPACTFHAICAIREISNNFSQVFGWLQTNNTQALSKFQRDIILEQGIPLYKQAVQKNPRLLGGADFEQRAPYFPQHVSLRQPYEPSVPPLFKEHLQTLLDWLYSQPQMSAWVKTGNELSFAVVVSDGKAIVFDTHFNEMIGTYSRDQLKTALFDKLTRDFQGSEDQLDFVPFDYAISS